MHKASWWKFQFVLIPTGIRLCVKDEKQISNIIVNWAFKKMAQKSKTFACPIIIYFAQVALAEVGDGEHHKGAGHNIFNNG